MPFSFNGIHDEDYPTQQFRIVKPDGSHLFLYFDTLANLTVNVRIDMSGVLFNFDQKSPINFSHSALSWVVQLTLDVKFSSLSSYSSVIVFSYNPALFPNSNKSECVRTDSLSFRRNNNPMAGYCYPMPSYGSGKFKVVFGVNPDLNYHICGDVTILVFK